MWQSATLLCDDSAILYSTVTKKEKPLLGESPADNKTQQRVIISRSLAGTRRVTPEIIACVTDKTERVLPNGDLYSGELSADVPHGLGKYLWADGCMYEGEWRKGKPSGKGNFSWPSGATYQGEFKSGRMDGFGTFIGADGDTYRGTWSADRKHGTGEKRYANGDLYEGGWRKNVQDGYGRFVWRNGNEYRGEWKNGVISGSGTLIWSNGARYDGKWENRVPLENDGNIITCDVVDDKKQFQAGLDLDSFTSEVKKPGQIIVKGHKNYEFMLNLQLGIRHSVGKEAAKLKELQPSDFDPKEKYWTRFPKEGSKVTSPHQSMEFRWKDYCPVVFRNLRKLFQVDPADYMLAICGNGSLRELSSPGKSGSIFYLTQDDRFMIKTVRKSEVKVLLRMLSSYYQHVSKHENTLLTKFYGLHCVKLVSGQKRRFIVMGNLFCSGYPIHKRFDLKGSSHGRSTDKQKDIDETTTLKDLDLNFKFHLQENWYTELIKQIDLDCKFLESERIMDYSLLVGVHFRSESTVDKMGLSPFLPNSGKSDSLCKEKFKSRCRFLEAELRSTDRVFTERKSLVRLGANMPARAERMSRKSDADQTTCNLSRHNGDEYEVIMYLGIIDILQDYDITKKLEHAYKSLQVSPASISAVDPKLYAKRFKEFIGRIFLKDE